MTEWLTEPIGLFTLTMVTILGIALWARWGLAWGEKVPTIKIASPLHPVPAAPPSADPPPAPPNPPHVAVPPDPPHVSFPAPLPGPPLVRAARELFLQRKFEERLRTALYTPDIAARLRFVLTKLDGQAMAPASEAAPSVADAAAPTMPDPVLAALTEKARRLEAAAREKGQKAGRKAGRR
jgi:hypothetical protein